MATAFHSIILKTAWRIAWQERRLWPFAFLAGLIIGSGIGSALIQLYGIDITTGWREYGVLMLTEVGARWQQARETGLGATIALGSFGIFVLASIILMVWATMVSTAAIVLGVGVAARGAVMPVGAGKQAIRCAGPVFAVVFVARVAMLIATVLWGIVLFRQGLMPSAFMTTVSIFLFVCIALILSIIHTALPFAIIGTVIDHLRPFRAIREALALIRERWLIIFETSVILTVANIVGVIAWTVGLFILALPFAFLMEIGSTRGALWLTVASFAVGGTVIVIFTAIIAMVITTFITSAWMTVYLRLNGPGEPPEPWILRVSRRETRN